MGGRCAAWATSSLRIAVSARPPGTRWLGSVSVPCFGFADSRWSRAFAPPAPPRLGPLCSPASSLLCPCQTSSDRSSPVTAPCLSFAALAATRQGDPKISQVPIDDIHTCLGSQTPQSPAAASHVGTAGVAFDPAKNLGTLNPLPFGAHSRARTHRYRRFISVVAGTDARLAVGRGVAAPSPQRTFTSCHLPVSLAVLAAEADGPAGSQRHFDGTDPAGLRRPRRFGAEVTRFGPCHSGGGEAGGLATRRRTLPLRRSAYRTALYLTASAADRPRAAPRARRRLRSG